jgi:hypothetical protein
MIGDRVLLDTNLKGRVKNTPLARSNALSPLLEAVVNSIQSIDASGRPPQQGTIDVRVFRESGLPFEDKQKRAMERIATFEVTDNGVGFNDDNMASFRVLDTEYKRDIGCRGVGRLLWLKAFDSVEVDSVFDDEHNGRRMHRFFRFTEDANVSDSSVLEAGSADERRTIVRLIGFKPFYRDAAARTASKIASAILEHCRFTFLRDSGPPRIRVIDGDEAVSLNELYEGYLHTRIVGDGFTLKGHKFDISHMKINLSAAQSHVLTWGADGREVFPENLAPLVRGLPAKLSDETGEFRYACYVTSHYLNEHVLPERTGFDLSPDDDLLSDNYPSMAEIRAEVAKRASEFLAPLLREAHKKTRARIDNFVATKAPRYRFVVAQASEDDLLIDPDLGDDELDTHLHKMWFKHEKDLYKESKEALKIKPGEDHDSFTIRAAEYLAKVADIQKSDLANYVAHRRVVLDALQDAVKLGSDGAYNREEVVHQLLMPMQKTSDQLRFDEYNLWVIDERLAFHDYLGSDKPLNKLPFVKLKSSARPDIVLFNVMDEPLLVSENQKFPTGSLSIVELKRPMRKDLKTKDGKDPIEQTLDYLEALRTGEATTKDGRPIVNAKSMPGFCYVVCDLGPPMDKHCRKWQLTPMHDNLGYFGYHKDYNAYIQVWSYEGIVQAALQRNRAFFDRLDIPL